MEHTQLTTPVNQPQPVVIIARKGKRWSPEEDAYLLEQVANNTSFDDIATTHQRTSVAISMRVLMHACKAVQEGMSVEDATARFRLPAERIVQGLNKQVKQPKPPKVETGLPTLVPNVTTPANKGKKWLPEEDAELVQRLNLGTSIEDIALAHQRKIPAIKRRIFTLALAAHHNGMSLDETSRLYRIPADKITKRIAGRPNKQPTVQRNTQLPVIANNDAQLEMLTEIRDLLRVLVAHMTKAPIDTPQ